MQALPFDRTVFDRARCAESERKAVLPLVAKLREISETAKSDGLYAIGRFRSDPHPGLAEAIDLVLQDGKGPAKDRLRAAALSGGLKGRALLERLMIAQALAGIDAGLAPMLVGLQALAYLGEEIFFAERREATIRFLMGDGLPRDLAEQIVG